MDIPLNDAEDLFQQGLGDSAIGKFLCECGQNCCCPVNVRYQCGECCLKACGIRKACRGNSGRIGSKGLRPSR